MASRQKDDNREMTVMSFLIDTHTHTIASGHAYNTINEMIRAAADKNMTHLAITDHAPTMPGSAHELYFSNLRALPRQKYGVNILYGSELNICDFEGSVDLPRYILKRLDIVIASYHTVCIQPGSKEENTRGLIHCIENPLINIIGHPDDARFKVDYEQVVLAARDNHKLLELNNSSLKPNGPREGAYDNDKEMLELCKRENVCITLASDAHVEEDVLNFSYALKLIEELDFPTKLIANSDFEILQSYLRAK